MGETQTGSTGGGKKTSKKAEAVIAKTTSKNGKAGDAEEQHASVETQDAASQAGTAKTKIDGLKSTVAKDVEIARQKAHQLGQAAMDAVKKVDKDKAKALGKEAMRQVDHAKESGKEAAKGALDVILGRRESPMLKLLVVGLRLIGIALFVLALFSGWFFAPLAAAIGWFATSVTGFALGFVVFGMAELVNLLVKIEGHLHAMAQAQRH